MLQKFCRVIMDKLSSQARSQNMSRIRSKGMKPEMIVRQLVHRMCYRYRLHRKELPGKPDLVFLSRKKVIFVHGCFWHQHESPDCPIARVPKSNKSYWLPKLESNKIRDRRNKEAFDAMGWKMLEIWECQIKPKNHESLIKTLKEFLGSINRQKSEENRYNLTN